MTEEERVRRDHLLELERQIRLTIDSFVHVLYNLTPSNSESRQGYILGLRDAYIRQLKSLGLADSLVRSLSCYSYILFELNLKASTPDNSEMLSFVVQYQIRVEHYLRNFLQVWIPLFPWKAYNENQKWTYKDYIDIWKNSDSNGDEAIRHGLREVGDIRNKFAHRLDYKLELKDLTKIKAYIEDRQDWYPGLHLFAPIDYYKHFCYAACVYFHNRTWQGTDWEWKIEKRNALPDWPDAPPKSSSPEFEI